MITCRTISTRRAFGSNPFNFEKTRPRSESLLTVGDVTLNELERSVTVLERPVELTGAEFHLLKLLLSQAGIPLAREVRYPLRQTVFQLFGILLYIRWRGFSDRGIFNFSCICLRRRIRLKDKYLCGL
jgi:hypothetical protein